MTTIHRFKGFTVIELIVVIVLLAIVGVVILSRFLGPAAFNEAATQDALISIIRSAQQSALGRGAVTFEIDAEGDDWVFTATGSSTPMRTIRIPSDNIELQTGLAAESNDTCADDPGAFNDPVTSNFVLAFNAKGDIASFTNGGLPEPGGPLFDGVRICVNDTVELSVCVSPAGYAYAGTCDG